MSSMVVTGIKGSSGMARKPLVALVGRPNVGKSTLFNRLVGGRLAVTDEIPGTTRDRIQAESEWNGVTFRVVDTGGIEIYQPRGTRDARPLAEGSIDFVPQIKAQAMIAINEADAVVLLVDATHGITAADEEIAEILRRTSKPVIVAANKADSSKRAADAVEFYALGLGQVYPISAIHGAGVGDLLDELVSAFQSIPPQESESVEEDHLKIAIVGRPNVGKSTLLNRLLGEERAIVSPIPGTTRDAIDTEIQWNGMPITLIDTAGIRKRGKIEPGVEKYSVLRAMNAIERADVALLLVDAEQGVTEQDEHVAGYILDAYKSVVIVVNKWDAVKKDSATIHQYQREIEQKLHFIPYAPVIFISAMTGQRIHQVLESAQRVWEARFFRVQTSELNRLKIFFASQVAVNPPLFMFHVNDKQLVHFTYRRYLENQIRAEYPFEGTPLRFTFRDSDSAPDRT
jgi:GTP-binding protein